MLAVATIAVNCASEERDREPYEYGVDDDTPQTVGAQRDRTIPQPGGAAVDHDFVNHVIAVSQEQIEAGRIAQQRAASPDVREFAQRMVRDHQRMNARLEEILSELQVEREPANDEATVSAGLTRTSGEEFDRLYMDEMVSDHEDLVAAMEEHVTHSGQRRVVQWAQTTRPVLRSHLTRARAVRDALD
jgi:putative membrane protein